MDRPGRPITTQMSAEVAKKICISWQNGIFGFLRNTVAENASYIDNPNFGFEICRLFSACTIPSVPSALRGLSKIFLKSGLKPYATHSNRLLFTLLSWAQDYSLQGDLSSSAHCLLDWTYYYIEKQLPAPPLDKILSALENVVCTTLASHVAIMGKKIKMKPLWLPMSWLEAHILPVQTGESRMWEGTDKVCSSKDSQYHP